jgi:hypothetical protein
LGKRQRRPEKIFRDAGSNDDNSDSSEDSGGHSRGGLRRVMARMMDSSSESEEEELIEERPSIPNGTPTSQTTSPTPTSPLARFHKLAQLPTIYKPLPTHSLRHFSLACERLAGAYLSDPSDNTLLDILALPKAGLHPAVHNKAPSAAKQILTAYPNVTWPQPPQHGQAETRSRVAKLVEAGRLSSAARSLAGQAKVAEVTEEVIKQLQDKHPQGPVNPFGPGPGPLPAKSPNLSDIADSLKQMAADTAPGVSGWTVPLLRQAMKLPTFARFMVSLTAAMAKGTAPGADMLCTSRLTPLSKPDGGVRPIAVGELFYRLATKTILKTSFKPDFLLPNQLGVGSKGGVEPIVRVVNRALTGSLPTKYQHLVSLDAANAFNTVNRTDIVTSLKKHAPALHRLAKWAYNSASDLLIGEGIIKSAQGVRQGDPLGPLLFSVAIRPLITRLIQHLGPNRLVIAYLDDMYVLSTDSTALADCLDFFDKEDSSLKLNTRKCATVDLDSVRMDGFKLLGTTVGSAEARRAFLQEKVTQVTAKLDELRHLPHQHALVLLRQCIQQDVRHLQRTLNTTDLPNCWDALDERLALEVKRLTEGGDRMLDKSSILSKLPARLGGIGILSHADCAPHAWEAAQGESDRILVPLVGQIGSRERRDGSPEEERRSQADRCREMWVEQRDRILEKMEDRERKLLMEAASTMGRKWLSVIPYNHPLRLSDYDIATGLAYRLQVRAREGHCGWCGDKAELGHDEICLNRPRATIGRHDAIVRVIGRHLASNHSTSVDIEPHTQEGQRRNDIQWTGSPSHGRSTIHFDVKVVSLLGAKSHSTTTRPPAGTQLVDHANKQCIKHLDTYARRATSARPLSTANFKPLVFSTGGLMAKETADEVLTWKGVLGDTVFGRLGTAISIELVKARARTYGLLR